MHAIAVAALNTPELAKRSGPRRDAILRRRSPRIRGRRIHGDLGTAEVMAAGPGTRVAKLKGGAREGSVKSSAGLRGLCS